MRDRPGGARVAMFELVDVVNSPVQNELLAIAGGSSLYPFDLDNGVAAAVYAVIGIVYGVTLAQLVVAAWSDYEAVQAAVFREAAALKDLVRLAQGCGEAHERAIGDVVAAYAATVLNVEWPAMARGVEPDGEGDEVLSLLYRLYAQVERGSTAGSAFVDA